MASFEQQSLLIICLFVPFAFDSVSQFQLMSLSASKYHNNVHTQLFHPNPSYASEPNMIAHLGREEAMVNMFIVSAWTLVDMWSQ